MQITPASNQCDNCRCRITLEEKDLKNSPATREAFACVYYNCPVCKTRNNVYVIHRTNDTGTTETPTSEVLDGPSKKS